MSDVPVIFDNPFPETQVRSPYKKYFNKIIGAVFVTSGFMEPAGHGFKRFPAKAIFRDGSMKVIQPGRYNIGFDYTKGFGSPVICMYSGKVIRAGIEGGYGHRIHVQLDTPFRYQGREYVCYQAYAHCSKLLKTVGQRVSQGEAIAIEAGHGGRHPRQYGSHVDLDTYCQINGNKVHINFELLAASASAKDYIEQIETMRVGARGLDVRWLQDTLKIHSDGIYGPQTQAAVEKFQRKHADLGVDGIAGEQTCRRLGLTGFAVYFKQSSRLKKSPLESQGIHLPPGNKPLPLLVNWVEDIADQDHWYIGLREPLETLKQGYVPKADVKIVKGYDAPQDSQREEEESGDILIDTNTQDLRHWEAVLQDCPTAGCKSATASPEGLDQAGMAASHEIARRDLQHLTPVRLEAIHQVAQKFNVPAALIAALASRESHIGSLLGKFGNDPGWGDNNHGWGILQVDRRFHTVKGLDDPYSQAHIDQAIALFNQYRDQIALRHPSWSDAHVLKGACVAYNSGVGNVRTIERMNMGTTHHDYGDDVIARAQFYLTALDSV
jgi:hypothetical protein